MAEKISGKLVCLRLDRNGRSVAAAAIRQKTLPGLNFGIVNIPSAPLLMDPRDAPEVLSTLREELVERGRNVLRLRFAASQPTKLLSDAELKELGFIHTSNARSYQTCLLDLRQPLEVLRRNLHSKWRNQLNKSDRASLSIDAGCSVDLIERFARLYAEMKRFKTFESSLSPDVLSHLSESDLRFEVLIAHRGGTDLGGHVTCYTCSVATYFLGATGLAGRDMNVGNALNWKAVENASARGIPVYDLGGIDQSENPQGFQFKTRMGGQVRAAFGPLEARPSGLAGVTTLTLERLYRQLRDR